MQDRHHENPIDRATEGAALAPLSPRQRQRLAALASWSLKLQVEAGLASDGTDFDDWRHRQCLMVAERAGLTLCRNEDYVPLRAHFLHGAGAALLMLGRDRGTRLQARAAGLLRKAETEPRRWALAKLRREMAGVRDVIQDPEGYVAQIARCKFKTTDVGELSDKQLWTLMFDVRRAAQRRRGMSRK